jgi:daunorubicin resistance ABC transporter ATP-binding subunit
MIIEAKGLVKRYGDTLAVDNIDLEVRRGSIVGVLGPNGAGKTTTLRMLTTLARPDAGSARVAGFDVVHEAASIRRIIGVTGQDATLDELLSGRQNLVMTGELSRMGRTRSRKRAQELLELLELEEAADRPVKGYSGGMRRRLDLAASIVSKPPILFLDEPTTGLDPTGRQKIWNIIRDLVESGATVLLTTQYLDEADALADEIVVINHGRVIAQGSPLQLKAATGSQLLEVSLPEPHPAAASVLAGIGAGKVVVSDAGKHLRVHSSNGHGLAVAALRALDEAGIPVDDIAVHQPSLDDAFAALTGKASAATNNEEVQ